MNNISKRTKLTILYSVNIFLLVVTYMFFKMATSVEYNKTLLIISFVPFVMLSVITVKSILNQYINSNLIAPNYIVIVITLVLTLCLCKYLTFFNFERWQEKEYLRQFMAMDLVDVQNNHNKYKNSEYRLNKYTEEERKELLSVDERKDENPEITVEFNDDSLSAEIYYAYNGIDFKDYWLVLVIRELDNGTGIIERAEIYPSGTTVNW